MVLTKWLTPYYYHEFARLSATIQDGKFNIMQSESARCYRDA